MSPSLTHPETDRSGEISGRCAPSSTERPRVSIGIPVYNGEAYLAEALTSIAAQTYRDYELIISDNASTDRTREICLDRARRDPRIRYFRNPRNIGGDPNLYRCFELAAGEYFLAVAVDDRLDPRYVEKAVEVLDADPSIVLCHSRAHEIDETGAVVRPLEANPFSESSRAHERFYDAICVSRYVVANFGMTRSHVLRALPRLASYPSADAFWQAELALRGRLYEIPEFLFERRIHAGGGHKIPLHERLGWSDPSKARALFFPTWRRVGEYLASIARVPLGASEKMRCLAQLPRYVRERRIAVQLLRDLRMAARGLALRTVAGRALHERLR